MKHVSDGELLLLTLPNFLSHDVAIIYVADDLTEMQQEIAANIFHQVATTSREQAQMFGHGMEAAVTIYQLNWIRRALVSANIALNETRY